MWKATGHFLYHWKTNAWFESLHAFPYNFCFIKVWTMHNVMLWSTYLLNPYPQISGFRDAVDSKNWVHVHIKLHLWQKGVSSPWAKLFGIRSRSLIRTSWRFHGGICGSLEVPCDSCSFSSSTGRPDFIIFGHVWSLNELVFCWSIYISFHHGCSAAG